MLDFQIMKLGSTGTVSASVVSTKLNKIGENFFKWMCYWLKVKNVQDPRSDLLSNCWRCYMYILDQKYVITTIQTFHCCQKNDANKCRVVTKWIKSCLLQCFGTFKMPILMFICVLVFRPEGQIGNPVRRDKRIYVRRILNASRISKTQLNSCTISPS